MSIGVVLAFNRVLGAACTQHILDLPGKKLLTQLCVARPVPDDVKRFFCEVAHDAGLFPIGTTLYEATIVEHVDLIE